MSYKLPDHDLVRPKAVSILADAGWGAREIALVLPSRKRRCGLVPWRLRMLRIKAVALLLPGLGRTGVAAAMQVTPRTVRDYESEAASGPIPAPKVPPRRPLQPPPSRLLELVTGPGAVERQILASHYGCSVGTLNRWIRKARTTIGTG
jgi:hypothetical protein